MLSAQEWSDYLKNEKHYGMDKIIQTLDYVGSVYDDGSPVILYFDYNYAGKTIHADLFYELDGYYFSHN